MAAELETSCFISGSCLGRGADLFDQMRRFSEEMCSSAEKHGVFFAVEPEPGTLINGSLEMNNLIKTVSSEQLRLNLDIGHSFLTEKNVGQDILQWENRIVHTHIEDIKGEGHQHLLPGTGDIAFEPIISALDAVGYSGFFVLDLFDIIDDPVRFARQGITALNTILTKP